MHRFRSLLKAKVLIPVFALGVGVSVYVATLPKADAGLSVCAYYSNATYTTVVGARGIGCCGSVINWGVTTAYKKCQNIYCTQQICPN
jgi:hypothetical protein